MSSNYINYSSGQSTNLVYYTTSLTNTITTSSETWITSGLAITPPLAGTYLVIFSGSVFCEGAGATIGETRILVGGVVANATVKQTRNTVVMLLGLIGGNNVNGGASNTVTTAVVNGTQTIEVQYRRGSSGSNISMDNRSLTLLRIA